MKFLHVTIQTNKFNEEVTFYEKYVGLTIQTDMRPSGRNMVFLADSENETNIEIIENPNAPVINNENISIGFKTDNLEEKRNQLSADRFNVTEIISPMPQVKFFFTNDPAGMKVQFM